MSLYIQNNYGTIHHIENSTVHIKPDGEIASAATKTPKDAQDVEFEEMPVYCVYLDIDAIKRAGIWTPPMVQEQLEKASEKDAKEFVAFLRDFEKKTYLNFHGDNKRKIYNTLRAQLPMMRDYTESNFYTYF